MENFVSRVAAGLVGFTGKERDAETGLITLGRDICRRRRRPLTA